MSLSVRRLLGTLRNVETIVRKETKTWTLNVTMGGVFLCILKQVTTIVKTPRLAEYLITVTDLGRLASALDT